MTLWSRRAVLLSAAAFAAACGATDPSSTPDVPSLQIQDLRVGTGAEATNGKTLDVTYAGFLYDPTRPDNKGAPFDSGPYSFPLGTGRVIRGWDQGLVGMRVGGQRRLIIPSALGYGAVGSPPVIPPNAALVFDVELLAVR
jgi:FKBP-type peptidyl-prolyl cis-trans isomerase